MPFPGLLNLATQAAGLRNAFVGGQEERRQKDLNEAMSRMTAERLAKEAAIRDALSQAQAENFRAQAQKALQPPPAPRDYVKEHQLNRDYDLAHPEAAKPTSPDLASRLKERVEALTSGGMPLEKANRQARLEYGQPPEQQAFTPITVSGGEDQAPVIKPFSTKTGEVGPTVGEAKPAATRIESATNTAAKARMEAAISEMNNAHSGMSEYERALANKTTSINGLQQFLGTVGSSFTHDDPASRAVQSAALAVLNRTNPPLARYIRRGLSFAEGESMISSRPSDFRTKMAAFLSTAASGASPDMIQDIESRRNSILDPLNRIKEQPKNSPSKPPTQDQQDWDAAVKLYGKDRVLKEYGPRPD